MRKSNEINDIDEMINKLEFTDNWSSFRPLVKTEIIIKIINFLNKIVDILDTFNRCLKNNKR